MDTRSISGVAYSRFYAQAVGQAVGGGVSAGGALVGGGVGSHLVGAASVGVATAPYLSPVYRFDPVARLSVLAFRDSQSGDVHLQIPSEKVVELYRRTRGDGMALRTVAAPVAPAARGGAGGDGAIPEPFVVPYGAAPDAVVANAPARSLVARYSASPSDAVVGAKSPVATPGPVASSGAGRLALSV